MGCPAIMVRHDALMFLVAYKEPHKHHMHACEVTRLLMVQWAAKTEGCYAVAVPCSLEWTQNS